jgi:hypothetical protein
MSKKRVSKKKASVKVTKVTKVERAEEPVQEPVGKPQVAHRHRCHVPGPRRKPKFAVPAGYDPKTGLSDGWKGKPEEDEAAATAEAESSEGEAPQPGGREKPLMYGKIDG